MFLILTHQLTNVANLKRKATKIVEESLQLVQLYLIILQPLGIAFQLYNLYYIRRYLKARCSHIPAKTKLRNYRTERVDARKTRELRAD